MSTIFKKIIDGELPADKVYEDERILAFKDIHPQAPVHILIIPKKEIAYLQDMQEQDFDLLGDIVKVAQKLAVQFKLDNGYRLVVNNGPDSGQEVFHLHFHLLGGERLAKLGRSE